MARIVLALALLAGANASLFTNDTSAQKYMWDSFKSEHGKTYSADEESKRFGIFVENLKVADERNAKEAAAGGSAQHGVTKFSDMSQEEFSKFYLNAHAGMKKGNGKVAEIEPLAEGVRGLVDWTGVYTTPVKNQMYCGSCWAFSAVEQIESDNMRQKGETVILSPEEVVQCDSTSYGCNGGWSESAYEYVESAGGLSTEDSYPYTHATEQGITGTCQKSEIDPVVGISGYTTVNGESSMASYVTSTGPLSVCLDASSWNSYTGGIMSVCGHSVDHCVQAVGVDTSSYWKVRNSWGTSWGESGFIRLAYGDNTCDITNDPTYVTIA